MRLVNRELWATIAVDRGNCVPLIASCDAGFADEAMDVFQRQTECSVGGTNVPDREPRASIFECANFAASMRGPAAFADLKIGASNALRSKSMQLLNAITGTMIARSSGKFHQFSKRKGEKMKKLLQDFIADETGATAIEYGLIAAGIAIAIIASVKGVGSKLSSNFATISTSLK